MKCPCSFNAADFVKYYEVADNACHARDRVNGQKRNRIAIRPLF
ncbi:MAG TPA: hypothetical protein VFL76_08435 [Edaphocola sp.]|nr:hypothetical protein [Edaphocola sp.]